jgi:hypothetical protein
MLLVQEEGEAAEHLLLGEPRFVGNEIADTDGELFVVSHSPPILRRAKLRSGHRRG